MNLLNDTLCDSIFWGWGGLGSGRGGWREAWFGRCALLHGSGVRARAAGDSDCGGSPGPCPSRRNRPSNTRDVSDASISRLR